MTFYYSPSTNQRYIKGVNKVIPEDAREISAEFFSALVSGEMNGKIMQCDADGVPVLLERSGPPVTAQYLCDKIDAAADLARRAVAGDPLRAVEYDRARLEAEQFAEASYEGDAPPMVAAWAINGRTPQQAAVSILAEAAQYTAALVKLRTVRLQAKEMVRQAMAADHIDQALLITKQTIEAVETAVAGIGNNSGA